MSVFDYGPKDDLEYEIRDFLEKHTIDDLLEVVNYCVRAKEIEYEDLINSLKEAKDGENNN